MSRAYEHDAQVHPEEEDLEDLGLGERQHDDAGELGQGDARENLQFKWIKNRHNLGSDELDLPSFP